MDVLGDVVEAVAVRLSRSDDVRAVSACSAEGELPFAPRLLAPRVRAAVLETPERSELSLGLCG